MAKNLYRLETPLVSEYNTETWDKDRKITSIELLPLEGIQQTPYKKDETNQITGAKFTYYKTNSPNLFWTIPE